MGMLMIECPVTGKPVPTGIAMDQQSFESSQLSNNSMGPCPHCRQMHTWSKPDAWVQDN